MQNVKASRPIILLARSFPPHWKTLAPLLIAWRAQRFTRHPLLKAFLLLCALNWRNMPFIWHLRVIAWLPFYRILVRLRANGLLGPPRGSRARELQLQGVARALANIGRSPFQVVYSSNEWCSIGDTDLNLHMSNSVYYAMADFNRFRWAVYTVGNVYAREKMNVALAEAQTIFIKEIPLFSKYYMETRIATWDHQWFWLYFRFLLPVPNRARNNPSFVIVRDAQGRERVLATCMLARGCYKLLGHKKSIHPGRVYALAGLGADATNWDHSRALRGAHKSKAWLKDEAGEGTPPGMMIYEDKRKETLELVRNLGGDKASWIALDAAISAADVLVQQ